jgi:general secretion pathway protein I
MRRRGFTMIEVLATVALLAIVLPAVMEGVTLATSAGGLARHRTEAAGLAESKLKELVATGDWQAGILSGEFDDWPQYRWEATVTAWSQDVTSSSIQQIDLRVIWTARGREDSITLSTLAYVRDTSSQTTPP